VEESHFPFLNQKQFVLVEMIVRWRTATGRGDLCPKGDFSSSLRTGKMDDNFFAKRMQRVALATSEDDGKASVIISTKLPPIVSLDKLCRSARAPSIRLASTMSRRLTLFARWIFEQKFPSDFQVGQPASARAPWRA